MKNLTKKRKLCYCLFLLMFSCSLHAAKSVSQPSTQAQKVDATVALPRAKRKLLVHGYCRAHDVPQEVGLLIVYFVYDNPLKYKNKTLPNDLSEQDLSCFDFTGCAFTCTNLTDTNLSNVILTNTTCNYQKAFQYNMKKNKIYGDEWFQNHLPLDLKSIAAVYPKLNNNTHKAKLLHIACGLSRLPFYESMDFYIKVYYWSCTLLRLRQEIDQLYGNQLVCSLASDINDDVDNHCWETEYPQDEMNIEGMGSHTNFAQYLNDFEHGLIQYNCKAKRNWGLNWYKQEITKNIQSLQKAYPNIEDKNLQQTTCNIAHALSKSYQVQHLGLLHHYLFYQNRLIRLKKLTRIGVKNDTHYKKNTLFFNTFLNSVDLKNNIYYSCTMSRYLTTGCECWRKGQNSTLTS